MTRSVSGMSVSAILLSTRILPAQQTEVAIRVRALSAEILQTCIVRHAAAT